MSDPETDLSSPAAADERAEAARLRAELDAVEVALTRLDDGTYGTCEVCGGSLPDELLARTPQTRLCPDHQI